MEDNMSANEMQLLHNEAQNDSFYGDEHLSECFGDCDIFCTCQLDIDKELQRQADDFWIWACNEADK